MRADPDARASAQPSGSLVLMRYHHAQGVRLFKNNPAMTKSMHRAGIGNAAVSVRRDEFGTTAVVRAIAFTR